VSVGHRRSEVRNRFWIGDVEWLCPNLRSRSPQRFGRDDDASSIRARQVDDVIRAEAASEFLDEREPEVASSAGDERSTHGV
jgi:hypothetical protein